MSDVSSAGRLPDPAYPVDVSPQPTYATGPAVGDQSSEQSKPRQVAEQTKAAAGQAAGNVTGTAKEQAQRVGSEAKTQARNVASEVRSKLTDQAHTQNGRLVGSIRQTADHLDEMRGTREDSPAAAVVSRIADGGRQFADYLDRNGPDGVLREVEDFARRRPGAFLATALAAGFVVGRLGKSVVKADSGSDAVKPSSDSFTSGYETAPAYDPAPGYATTPAYDTAETVGYVPASTGTGYVTPATTQYNATGTGTPAVVERTDPEFRS